MPIDRLEVVMLVDRKLLVVPPTLAAFGDRSDLEPTLEYEHNAIVQSNKAAI